MLEIRRRYIYHKPDWPRFTWDHEELINLLATVRGYQGRLVGKMEVLGFDLKGEAALQTLSQDVLKSSEIEGELLDFEQVRSSLARRLGMDVGGLVPSARDVDGVVDMMVDATRNYEAPLSKERLSSWHVALFPTGRNGMYSIRVGEWRDDAQGPMRVVSGAYGKEKLHFEAPPAEKVPGEMEQFLAWFNDEKDLDPVVKAAVAHLWFLTIHPFDDGNGRIARAITDLQLARADRMPQRFYSMSAQIHLERKGYYELLEKTQAGDLDITRWMQWFLNCLLNSLKSSNDTMLKVMKKHHFWLKNGTRLQNDRQHRMLNMLLDGFEGKLTSTKWAKITKTSPDTALRDIQDLIDKQILRKMDGGGRSTGYELEKIDYWEFGNWPPYG